MSQKIITKGNRAVVIHGERGSLTANVYVNARNGLQDADITPTRWTGKTWGGALRWADKQLAQVQA